MSTSVTHAHDAGCPFCLANEAVNVVDETVDAYLIKVLDKDGQVMEGCYFIIPKQHVTSVIELPGAFQLSVSTLLKRIPDIAAGAAYNLSYNQGGDAGQRVDHVHAWVVVRKSEQGMASYQLGLVALIAKVNAALVYDPAAYKRIHKVSLGEGLVLREGRAICFESIEIRKHLAGIDIRVWDAGDVDFDARWSFPEKLELDKAMGERPVNVLSFMGIFDGDADDALSQAIDQLLNVQANVSIARSGEEVVITVEFGDYRPRITIPLRGKNGAEQFLRW